MNISSVTQTNHHSSSRKITLTESYNKIGYKGVIVIVDDSPTNLGVMFELLSNSGFKVLVAQDGYSALEKVNYAQPDLILLDIMMPGIDGFETCRRLKAQESTRDIPVIFMTARTDTLDKVKGFRLGAVDYLTKPVQQEEVRARVNTHLKIGRLQKQLQAQNFQLQKEIKQKQEAEHKYRSIFENATEGIFQVTPKGKFITANPALASILGYQSPEQLINQVTDIGKELYLAPRRRDDILALIHKEETLSEVESEVYRKDGMVIWISENIRAVRDNFGDLLYYEGTLSDITERKKAEDELRRARTEAELLLLNILPQPVAEQLKKGERTLAESFEDVTVLFADLVDFTKLSTQTSPTELVEILNVIFSEFDQLAEEHGVEKIKTIGDAYMAVAGLPKACKYHADAIAKMALDMQKLIAQYNAQTNHNFRLRIGINSGPVVAGVIGIKKFSYDLWGDTVNMASRMESQGIPGGIQVTVTTYEKLKDKYRFEQRQPFEVKGKGKMTTYLLTGPLAMGNG
ncbi:MAG: response regulator [Moorea sp. SIO4G2]|nr:response regulator [Moorena sp. SIO4G2]